MSNLDIPENGARKKQIAVTESWELPEFWELNDWTDRMEYFFMLRCLMRCLIF